MQNRLKGGDRLEKSKLAKILAGIIVIGAICFGTGYYLGGRGVTAYATTKPITVSVQIVPKDGPSISKTVTVRDGMTVFDALLKVADIQTKYWESFDSSTVISIASYSTDPTKEGYVYEVNGISPPVAMTEYQLHDGDQIKVYYAQW